MIELQPGETLKISTASKTFLVGEYLALAGGPSIVANTAPRFELFVSPLNNGELEIEGINEDSPAGQFIQKNKSDFVGQSLKFIDPHSGRGGLGASSAQFALCYSMSSLSKTAEALLESYLDCAWNGQGRAPSGSDVIAQMFGSGLTWVDKSSDKIKTTAWPFQNLHFALLRTGEKVATHLHLNELQLEDVDELKEPVERAWQGLIEKEESTFLKGLHDFSQGLSQKGWVAETTQSLMKRLSSLDEIVEMKGCGALGADILLVCYRSSSPDLFLTNISALEIEIAATSKDLCQGLHQETFLENTNETAL